MKKFIALVLVLAMTSTMPVSTFAATPASAIYVPPGYEDVHEAYSTLLSIDEQLERLGTSLDFLSKLPQKSDAFYERMTEIANERLGITSRTARAATVSEDSDTAAAKSAAYMYAHYMATWSVRQEGRGRDVNREATYMYLSHYIDRQGNYWDVMDPSTLLDGPSMSNDGYMAKWITNYDRDNFDIYLRNLARYDFEKNMTKMFVDVSTLVLDPGNAKDITLQGKKLKEQIGQFFSAGEAIYSGWSMAEDFGDYWNSLEGYVAVYDDPDALFELLYDDYGEEFSDIGGELLISLSFAALGAACGGGVLGIILAAGGAAVVSISVAFNAFMDYVSWLSLSQTRQSRIAYRLMRYYGMI